MRAREDEIVAAQNGHVRAMLDALKGTQCPNCFETLPAVPALTPTGVVVCDDQCVVGWMNGEEGQKTLELIRRLRRLMGE